MKHFGTVQSFDELTGIGAIRPEEGGKDLRFKGTGQAPTGEAAPVPGLRLSYHLGVSDGRACAVDLHAVLPRETTAREGFTVFRTAAEEAMLRSNLRDLDEDRAPQPSQVRSVAHQPADFQRSSEGLGTIEHTFIADWQHVLIPLLLTVAVGGIAAMLAFLP